MSRGSLGRCVHRSGASEKPSRINAASDRNRSELMGARRGFAPLPLRYCEVTHAACLCQFVLRDLRHSPLSGLPDSTSYAHGQQCMLYNVRESRG